MEDFALTLLAKRLQARQGWRALAGSGVLVISACIGESPRKHRTEVVTKTLSWIEASQASTPLSAKRLPKNEAKIECFAAFQLKKL